MQQLSLALDPDPPVLAVHQKLKLAFGSFANGPRLPPIDQLVRSLIAGRTYDEVSWPTYYRLKARYRPWERLVEAPPGEIQAIIAPVTFADIKAGWLPEALARIMERGALSLDFLADIPVEEAIVWLRKLPGVGDKVAASVLNFSTLGRRAMVIDPHVWRVARRIGLAPRNADPQAVRHAITDAVPADWAANDFFDLHWLLKRLGQTLCQDQRTRCGGCPVATLCAERRRQGAGRANVVSVAFGAHGNKQ
jgi:endonuclease-3